MIDLKKTYQTSDGRPVNLYEIAHRSVFGRVDQTPMSWELNGAYMSGRPSFLDLVEVKPEIRREFWVNVYQDCETLHKNKNHADESLMAGSGRIACVRVEVVCREGDGLGGAK